MAWGQIDDEAVADAQSLIGVDLRHDQYQWVRDATHDAISHFVQGIGDNNPLWLDPEYASRTRWGTVIAPGCFLYAVDLTVIAPKLPGVQAIYAGCDWTWYDVVRVGDSFTPKVALRDVTVKSGAFAKAWVMQTGTVHYQRDSDGQLVALAVAHNARTPRGEALKKDGSTKYEERGPYQYSAEEIASIEKEILNEEIRGAEPRYWEDVAVGDTVGSVKGPLTTSDIVAYYAGTCGQKPYGGVHGDALRYRRRHADYHVSEKTGAKDSAGRGHVEAKTGKDVGMGGAYDVGPQRLSWAGHMLTNWMGDDGFLHQLFLQTRKPNLVGDTTRWTGTVVDKVLLERRAAINLRLEATNQFGDTTAKGTAVVLLPSREHGPIDLPIPGG